MRSLRLLSVAFGLSFGGVAFVPVGCGNTTQHPPPAPADREGGTSDYEGGAPLRDAASDGAKDAPADALPPECTNNVKDPLETAVDCGGSVCPPCADGKTCVSNTDCIGKSCVPADGGGPNICTTATCTDNYTNGEETDKDCGGSVCPHCTFGKKCTANTDCVSNTCTANQCACPAEMVVVATNGQLGGAYCVDKTEVTSGAYYAFVQANPPILGQPPQCTGNLSYVPQANWPPPQPLTSYGVPVRDVDWCDAYAYCRWAGKTLCGQIGGGAVAQSDANDKSKSAWYNACSAQGVNAYPYDVTTFDPSRCRGNNATLTTGEPDKTGPWYVWSYGDNGGNNNQQLNVACQGGTVELFQMSGNLREWEDSCDGTTGGTDKCNLRGGSYKSANSKTDLACARDATSATASDVRLNPDPTNDPHRYDDVGFRCCK